MITPPSIESLVTAELQQAASSAAQSIAAVLRNRYGDSVRAVLFYGSCLRNQTDEGVLDFYLIVDCYRDFYKNVLSAAANRILPPTVLFMREDKIAAKIAVISLDQFARRMTMKTLDTAIWARFAQPACLVFVADRSTQERIVAAIACAVRTALQWAQVFEPLPPSTRDLWSGLFAKTYGAELRAERVSQAQRLYESNPARYDALARSAPSQFKARAWILRRIAGKLLSILRLAKGAFTFSEPVEYVLFKIERHSGVALKLTPWQHRHPVLAAPILLAKLYRKGAVR